MCTLADDHVMTLVVEASNPVTVRQMAVAVGLTAGIADLSATATSSCPAVLTGDRSQGGMPESAAGVRRPAFPCVGLGPAVVCDDCGGQRP
ncbi:hypothetical protein SCAB_2651 [Streptomyces scabiei 87.22]|uniref:Uncharacterized protein n=1 Tax=Streptomyces scabiei (strain 87.22) TaxID=680198 RepID=C9ZEL7_STRSW|nr:MULTISPECIES: hypothetical protein [Streptomyces]MBP5934374.1 hypothetical protein [Streptomyces sp. LBUM 1479]MDX2656863.1 hypothetical protein [Streptomyces scabiei]MDX2724297.1 hypothetical protein [Streptomyces scabiei]MDX2994859.1 hypothetical protein [Streptomyces scabiei]MDX3027816.1 hypothetical protein [Streptomyces scabiei]